MHKTTTLPTEELIDLRDKKGSGSQCLTHIAKTMLINNKQGVESLLHRTFSLDTVPTDYQVLHVLHFPINYHEGGEFVPSKQKVLIKTLWARPKSVNQLFEKQENIFLTETIILTIGYWCVELKTNGNLSSSAKKSLKDLDSTWED